MSCHLISAFFAQNAIRHDELPDRVVAHCRHFRAFFARIDGQHTFTEIFTWRSYDALAWFWSAPDDHMPPCVGRTRRASGGLARPGRERGVRGQHRRHQLRVDSRRRVPRDVHAGRVRDGGDRLHAGKKRRAHDHHELHGLRHRDAGLLGGRIRPPGGRRRRAWDARGLRQAGARSLADHRGQDVGLVRRHGILPDWRRLHRAGVRLLLVPNGLHGHGGHDSDGRAGRAVEVLGIRRVQRTRRRVDLSDLRELDLGGRLARHARKEPRAGSRAR